MTTDTIQTSTPLPSLPWIVDTSRGYPWDVIMPDGETICRIGGHDSAIEDEEANESNARLIAAAPELLTACRDLVDCLDNITTAEFRRGGEHALRERARAAIAKAVKSDFFNS